MIGKSGTGASFGGLMNYLLDEEKEAEILAVDGVCDHDKETAIEDFNNQRKLRPNLGKAVWHSSISFDESDNLSDEKMKEIAQDFMKGIGIENTQYMVVKHKDKDYDHLHIVANRVDFEGKAITDSHIKNKAYSTSLQLEKKYGLVQAKGKTNQRKEAIKESIHLDINQGKDFAGIMKGVEKLGYTVQYSKTKLKEGGERINGVSYKDEKNGLVFKASEVDRNLSFSKILKLIEKQKQYEKAMQEKKQEAQKQRQAEKEKVQQITKNQSKNQDKGRGI